MTPANIPDLIWWAFGGILALCGILIRLAVWFVGQKFNRLENDFNQHCALRQQYTEGLESRIRMVENGHHLRDIMEQLELIKIQLARMEAREEERRKNATKDGAP